MNHIVNEMLDREWTSTYTCHEFVCEAWQKITGECLESRLTAFLNGNGDFEKLSEPISPCIAHFKLNDRSSTHVGLFFEGQILHLHLRNGQHVPLEDVMIHFKEVGFYR